MKWEQIQGKWQEYKGRVKQRWGKLTDQDLMVIDGKRDVLLGKLRERIGTSKEHAEKEIAAFEASCEDATSGCSKEPAIPGAVACEPASTKPSMKKA